MSHLTSALARHVCTLTPEALPGAVRDRTALLVLDLWGIMLRARFEAESTASFIATLGALGLDQGASRVVGQAQGCTPYGAALLNGSLAHSLDFDDTHAAGSVHPGAPVIPAAMAAAQMPGADPAALPAAIIAGYDVVCRLSMALVPSTHYERGFHPTATCGVFGAAAAAGRVLGFEPPRLEAALGLCGSMAAGSMQFLENGAWNKRWQVGAAAANGLAAACAAQQGFVGAATPLEGRFGFLHGYSPAPVPERVTEALGQRFDIMETAVKPYPACRYTHAAIDGLLALRARHALDPARIAAVTIGLPAPGIALTGVPVQAKRRPVSVVDGQFSMHFTGAVALLTGGFVWDDYGRHLGCARVQALADRLEVINDPRVEALYPRRMAASVRIETTAGAVLETLVEIPGGEPETFPDEAGHKAKFASLVGPLMPPGAVDALTEAVLQAGRGGDLRLAFDLSLPEPGRAGYAAKAAGRAPAQADS